MASQFKQNKSLHPLSTHWNNKSHSSIITTSDTATFHSARAHTPTAHMELQSLAQTPPTTSSHTIPLEAKSSPRLESIKMSRQDSGYSEPAIPNSNSSSRRTSLSTSSGRHSSLSKTTKRRTTTSTTASSTSHRPSTKRASRSSPQIVQLPTPHSRRPSMQGRHTMPSNTISTNTNNTNQFFQFPSLSPERVTSVDDTANALPHLPPPTINYWTSDSTRRLEYAAIDAASRGVRGFFIRLVPDCILPREKRRIRFCDGEEGSDAGSVRRYRLDLPAEKGSCVRTQECKDVQKGLRRWFGLGKQTTQAS